MNELKKPEILELKLKQLNSPPGEVKRVNDTESRHGLATAVRTLGILRLPVVSKRTLKILDGQEIVGELKAAGEDSCVCCVVDVPESLELAVRMLMNNHVGDWCWEQVSLALDVAASEFYDAEKGLYILDG